MGQSIGAPFARAVRDLVDPELRVPVPLAVLDIDLEVVAARDGGRLRRTGLAGLLASALFGQSCGAVLYPPLLLAYAPPATANEAAPAATATSTPRETGLPTVPPLAPPDRRGVYPICPV